MSYRNFLLKTLNRNDLVNVSKSGPEGVRYCNALCQDFRKEEEFSNKIPTCKNCRNKINMGEKQIKEGSITLEEFKNNPNIVDGVEYTFDTNKTCNVCKEEKSIIHFESNKCVCKACRSIQAVQRNNKDFDILISDVEKAKNNLIILENFVKGIPKDKLIKVISHFEIGRKSTDKKENMVYNIVNHFRKLLQPKLCQGGCGATLEVDFSTCLGCENKKDKPRAVSKMINFTENIDDIIENLTEIKNEDYDTYNREQLYRIHEKLTGIKPKQKTLKEEVIVMINSLLKKRDEEKQKIKEEIELQNKLGGEITLNGITVLAREDGFINATAMCKAGGKLFGNWHKSEPTKELIKALQNKINTDIHFEYRGKSELIEIKKGGNDKNTQGSWIHPDLAVHLAMWISPTFGIQVSGWVRELALTGSVTIGKEKTSQQLLELQKDFKKLEDKHRKLLQKKQYYKFKEGPAFYIISDIDGKSVKFKPGFEGVDIDTRLQQHRSTTPGIKLEYLIYSSDAALVETAVLKRFESKRKIISKEWVFDVDVNYIIKSTRTILDVLNIEYIEEKSIEEYNNQIMLDFK